MLYHAPHLRKPLLIFIFQLLLLFAHGQQIDKAVNNAFILTRMAEKFHVQPRPLDDGFSSDILIEFLKRLDANRVFFYDR